MNDQPFTASTRKRGEIDWHPARWKPDSRRRGGYEVIFLAGPHKGEKYSAIECAKTTKRYLGVFKKFTPAD